MLQSATYFERVSPTMLSVLSINVLFSCWKEFVKSRSFPKILQSFWKKLDMKFVPLWLWRLTAHPDLVIHMATNVQATSCASLFGILTNFYFSLYWSRVKKLYSQPSKSKIRGPAPEMETKLNNCVTMFQFLRHSLLFQVFSNFINPFPHITLHAGSEKKLLGPLTCFSRSKWPVHGDSRNECKLCRNWVSVKSICCITCPTFSSCLFMKSSSTVFSISLKSIPTLYSSF